MSADRNLPVSQATLDILADGSAEKRDAEIIAGAVAFKINFFIGRGAYERAATFKLEDARDVAILMKAAYPDISGWPMIYAIDASGASALIVEKRP